MMRVWLLTGGTLLLLAGLTYGVVALTSPPPPARFATQAVTMGNLSLTDSATGEVVPGNEVSYTIPGGATIGSLKVSLGQTVARGQVLAVLQDPALTTQLAQAEAALLAAQNQVALLSSPSYQASLASALAQAQDNLTAAENTLAADEAALTLVAPQAGTVNLLVTAGQSVASGQPVASVSGKTVAAPGNVTVSRVLVSPGAAVTAGQPLVDITSPALAAKLASDQSQIAGLQAALDKAEASSSPSQQTTALAQARAQLAGAQQTFSADQAAVNQLTITAPFAGQVVALNNSPTAAGGKLLTVANTQYDVEVPVPETQITEVHIGQQVNATLPAFPGRSFAGTISAIAPVGDYTNGVSSFLVTATLNHPAAVRDGMSAEVNIVVQTVRNQLIVPLAAIHYKNSRAFVLVLTAAGKPRRVAVHIVLQNASSAAVRSGGLAAGARVVTATLSANTQKMRLRANGRALHQAKRQKSGGTG